MTDLTWVGQVQSLLVRFFGRRLNFKLIHFMRLIVVYLYAKFRCKGFLKGFDLVIIPHNAHLNHQFNTLVKICKIARLPTLALQENWDGLATKSFIKEEPTAFCIWGEQSYHHLLTIQNLYKCKVKISGSPRMKYFEHSEFSYNKPSHLLVAGTGNISFDILLLETLKKSVLDTDIKSVIYRLHPVKSHSSGSLSELISYLREYPKSIKVKISENRNAAEDLQQSCLVITHFSTVGLEALCNGIPVIVPLFIGQESVNYSFVDIYHEWSHMQGLATLSHAKFPKTSKEFDAAFRFFVQKGIKVPLMELQNQTSWFCAKTNYPSEVASMIQITLS
jgi:hypothetical protein